MSHLLKEIPTIERPRERLEMSGAKSLSVAELIAIILRCGIKNHSAVELSYEILKEFETLENLSNATISELCKIRGIYKAKAISIIASLELGKRLANDMKEKKIIHNMNDAYNLVKDDMQHLKNEEILVIYLNIKGEVINIRKVSIGTITHTSFNTKEIITWALKNSSNHLIVCHNHPSGDPTPSDADKDSTYDLITQATILGIAIVDHLIIGKKSYYSFKLDKIVTC